MEKLYRIKESTLRNLTESVKNITGKTEEIVVGNISNEINYKVEELDNEIVAQTTLISEQDVKIAELAEILSGKAGGGGTATVDTCTIIFENKYDYAGEVCDFICKTYENGQIVVKHIKQTTYSELMNTVFDNVVCGSLFAIINQPGHAPYTINCDKCEIYSGNVNYINFYTAPIERGATAKITYVGLD